MSGPRYGDWRLVAQLPLLRDAAAWRLRRVAERLESPGQSLRRRRATPLIRINGRWWHRDELFGSASLAEQPSDGGPLGES
jgi:hypothetical protein